MLQRFLDLVLAHGPPDVVLALLLGHVPPELMYLDRAVPAVFQVIRAVHLAEAAAPDHVQQLVLFLCEERVRAEVRPLGRLQALHVLQVQRPLDLELCLAVLYGELFAVEEGYAADANLARLPHVVGFVAALIALLRGAALLACVRPSAPLLVELSAQSLYRLPVVSYTLLHAVYRVSLIPAFPTPSVQAVHHGVPAEPQLVSRRSYSVALLGVLHPRDLH
mmetsp:Transcript_43633/g.123500  ORF Transcript_43633/g.123500 Transcript_43633/m.123500 type:complete len:221 (-) Transcript_43633:89-751(-)